MKNNGRVKIKTVAIYRFDQTQKEINCVNYNLNF